MKIEIPDYLIEQYRDVPQRFLRGGGNMSVHIKTLVERDLQELRAAVHDTDGLTGCRSKNKLPHDIQELVWQMATSPSKRFLSRYLCLDIDNFKSYLDQHGLPASDKVLAEIAQQLRERYDRARIYRSGGDEFIVELWQKTYVPLERIPEITVKHSIVEFDLELGRRRHHHICSLISFYLHKGNIEATAEGTTIKCQYQFTD